MYAVTLPCGCTIKMSKSHYESRKGAGHDYCPGCEWDASQATK